MKRIRWYKDDAKYEFPKGLKRDESLNPKQKSFETLVQKREKKTHRKGKRERERGGEKHGRDDVGRRSDLDVHEAREDESGEPIFTVRVEFRFTGEFGGGGGHGRERIREIVCAISRGSRRRNVQKRVGRREVSTGVGVGAQSKRRTFATRGEYFNGRDVGLGRRFDAQG
tara:strand:- start:2093 stop:2602 length:510 start_codon:yes stop_codon:yes gene_type:complete